MDVVFRTDASLAIGIGHVMRCLTLAGALRERGADVLFVCRQHLGDLCALVEQRGFTVVRLPTSREGSQRCDAERTSAAIEARGVLAEWLVVDHYGLDARWESELRGVARRIMVIDDLANRAHDCDVLLDQNFVREMEQRYVGKVPTHCALLLGPKYALLQPTYASLHERAPLREGPVRRMLLSFGGADAENVTAQCLAAFLRLKRPNIEIDVVVPSASPHIRAIQAQSEGHDNVHLHADLPSLAALMVKADLAIGASGTTTWERLCVGLPSLVVTISENQRPIAERLSELELIHWIGHQRDVNERSIEDAIREVIDAGLDVRWSERCHAIVDGRGAVRVCGLLTTTKTTPLRVRHAMRRDEQLVLDWANDLETRQSGFVLEPITAATHHAWFREKLRDLDGCRFYIVETNDGDSVGQVRFQRSGTAWEVNYAVAPAFRGRGLGSPMLCAALRRLQSDGDGASIVGRVKEDNKASRKIFESLGFEMTPATAPNVIWYRRPFQPV